ncbi:DNA-binding protein [Spirosoma sp. HMF4905]|uniref:DNA-binding protein n=2 Tax=Spirosoma arboris TaxID=2682092 RepID=A0A7K1S654_9BACT|nr:DNA-binding protein [Spirosoma arboris]
MKMIVRSEVRSELASYVPAAPKVVALPDFPSKRQTKEALGVTNMTLTNWSKPTKERPALLIPFKIGSRIRYRREDVLALLNDPKRLSAIQNKVSE